LKSVGSEQGMEYLKQMKFCLRQPATQHQETNLEAQEEWKKVGSSSQTDSAGVSRHERRDLVWKIIAWGAPCDPSSLGGVRCRLPPSTGSGNGFVAVYVCQPRQERETYWWLLPSRQHRVFNRVLKTLPSISGWRQNQQVIFAARPAGWHITEVTSHKRHLLPMPLIPRTAACGRPMASG